MSEFDHVPYFAPPLRAHIGYTFGRFSYRPQHDVELRELGLVGLSQGWQFAHQVRRVVCATCR